MARRSGKGSDGVGYGHPPPEGQFRMGTSGNYRGRPRKPRSYRHPAPTDDDVFARESLRMLKHVDGNRPVESMALELVTRRVFQEAIKGKPLAAKLVFDEIRRREDRSRRMREEALANAIDRKRDWAETKRQQLRLGRKLEHLEQPMPHPDEFLITRYGDVHSVDLESQAAFRKLVGQRDKAQTGLSLVQLKLRRLEPGHRRDELAAQARELVRQIKALEQAIPDFWDDVVFELFEDPETTPPAPRHRRSKRQR